MTKLFCLSRKSLKRAFGFYVLASALGAGLVLGFGANVWAQEETHFVSIGSGGATGVYYPAGGAICRLVNKGRRTHGIRCSVESTMGSAYNIDALRKGDLDFAIAQSDVQFAAVNGLAPFDAYGPFTDLRLVFSLHAEAFSVLARADAGVRTFDDLKGKRVNIGNPGSGQRVTLDRLMKVKGWTNSDFSKVMELTSSEQSKALCDNQIDAIVFMVGHPNASIKEAATSCDVVLVNVTGKDVQRLIDSSPYFRIASIPGQMYTGSKSGVQTFEVGATLVTTAKTPNVVVYEMVKAVFEHIDDLRHMHAALEHLDVTQMAHPELSAAPLHPGALKYFKEVGLVD
jgi:TRAP transporter TAXI family solute receptor